MTNPMTRPNTPDPRSRLVSTEDGRLSLVERGSGPPVVFVHGTPSGAHEFADVMAQLEGHHTVAVEHLGFGGSDKPAGIRLYSVAAHQRRFSQAMGALDPKPAVFVLTDFGAAFALPWLLKHPERVRGVVLSNTFLWRARGPMAWLLGFYATPPGRWMYRVMNLSAKYLLPFAWGKKKPLTRDKHEVYLKPFARAAERYATSALPQALLSPEMDELEASAGRLAQFSVEAVWGLADPMVGADALARWREILPRMPVREVPEAGHFLADEAPEEIAMAVRRLSGHRQAA